MAADLAGMFDTELFGREALYNGASCTVLLLSGEDLDGQRSGGNLAARGIVRVLASALAAIPAYGDTITCDGLDWTVTQIRSIAAGIYTLAVERDQRRGF